MFAMEDRVILEPTEQAAVLALVDRTEGEWYRTSQMIDEAGSALRLLQHAWPELASIDRSEAEALVQRVSPADLEHHQDLIDSLAARGVDVITVVDDRYPLNLRQIYNRPPMLFVRGALLPADDRAIAVVGTRDPTPDGIRDAGRLARGLAEQGVTVISGLALGIDTAAHEAALGAGGRTVAIMGTGIDTIYPKANRTLADDIARNGALVSQFWPSGPPTTYSFPMRNIVMSGISLGTVVVEASGKSGARNQARRALEHGKRLFLLESLVAREEWARRYAERPGTIVVHSVDDILAAVENIEQPVKQLTLG
jgi:DNA processing protein